MSAQPIDGNQTSATPVLLLGPHVRLVLGISDPRSRHLSFRPTSVCLGIRCGSRAHQQGGNKALRGVRIQCDGSITDRNLSHPAKLLAEGYLCGRDHWDNVYTAVDPARWFHLISFRQPAPLIGLPFSQLRHQITIGQVGQHPTVARKRGDLPQALRGRSYRGFDLKQRIPDSHVGCYSSCQP